MLARGGDTRLAATAWAAAKDKSTDQRDAWAAVAPARSNGGAGRAAASQKPDELRGLRVFQMVGWLLFFPRTFLRLQMIVASGTPI